MKTTLKGNLVEEERTNTTHGVSGTVKLMIFVKEETGKRIQVAVKKIPLSKGGRFVEDFSHETRFYETVPSHPNICGFYGTIEGNDGVLVLQRLGESLLEKLRTERSANTALISPKVPPEFISVVADGAKALAHCHLNGFVVCDVHCGNLLENKESGCFVFADFGLAQHITKQRKTTISTFAGHRRFISPEVCAQKLRHEPLTAALNPSADVCELLLLLLFFFFFFSLSHKNKKQKQKQRYDWRNDL